MIFKKKSLGAVNKGFTGIIIIGVIPSPPYQFGNIVRFLCAWIKNKL